MVLETFSQSLIPAILQKLIFKQENESRDRINGDSLEDVPESSRNERRKVKKRRRREKRKSAESSEGIHLSRGCEGSDSEDKPVEIDEEFLDMNSAFVSLAVSRKKVNNNNLNSETVQSGLKTPKLHVDEDDMKCTIASERLAIQGCKLAAKEYHDRAIDMFTKAIELTPNDCRFYGNRSFCFCQIGQYKRALKDAEKAIFLAPENPKGYFRKAEALKGLNRLKESKDAFEHVLKLDKECEDARVELEIVKELLEVSSRESNHLPVNHIDYLQSPGGSLSSVATSFHSDVQFCNRIHSKMDPLNPDGSCSLWIGNISSVVTEQQLISTFSKYGRVSSVRILPNKFCAFVNYQEATSAGMAMRYLQRSILCGERILIRYPDNPSVVLTKISQTNSHSSQMANTSQKSLNGRKFSQK